MHKKPIHIILIIFLFCNLLYAQTEWTSNSKKAVKYLEEGLKNLGLQYYDIAYENIESSIKCDKNFVEAYLAMGQLYEETYDYNNASEYYKKADEIKPGLFSMTRYYLARSLFNIANYTDALYYFNEFIDQDKISDKAKANAKKYIQNCCFAINAIKNPVEFNPVNLGITINTKYDEYWPSVSADENIMVYTTLIPIDTSVKSVYANRQEDFYISYRINDIWQKAKSLGPPINTFDNEGAQSLSVDGKYMYFTACNRNDGEGMCDIYYSDFENGQWKEPINLGSPVNTTKSEKQPSISPDGTTLYFVSNRNDGAGKLDIWYSKKMDNGKWDIPVNLGDSINTVEDEMTPFIHPDGKTLYFTSNGHVGMGGYDLYMSRKREDGSWSKPVNLGYPINTQFDEMGMIVNAKGDRAYYSTDQKNGMGKDLFYFNMPDKLKPVEVSYIKGKIFDADSKEHLKARFEIIKLKSAEITSASYSDAVNGEFLISLPTDNDYALNVSKKGYLFYSENFSFTGIYSQKEPLIKDIPLQPIKEGKSITLNNIFFEHDSYELKKESEIEMNKIIDFLNLNPGVKVEIGGHTDNTGTTEYNKQLSEKRAKEVVKYLNKQGININRMVAIGYGEEIPVVSNNTEEGKAKNRRTEFKIIEIIK